MCPTGVTVSLETQNGLLGLLAYYGPGNKAVAVSVPHQDGEEETVPEKAAVESMWRGGFVSGKGGWRGRVCEWEGRVEGEGLSGKGGWRGRV